MENARFACLAVWYLMSFLSPVATVQAAPALNALVAEYQDQFTTATGAVQILQQAGFNVTSLNLAAAPNLTGIDLVLFGSFVSEHPSYASFIAANTVSLQQFVTNGGVLVQMTQADQTESAPAFLPSSLQAIRADPDFSELWMTSGEHPLLEGLPRGGGNQIIIPDHLNHGPNWEAFTQQSSFRVLLASDPQIANYALLEGVHGTGRIVLASLFLDKLYRNGSLIATQAVADISLQFFRNLSSYVALVRAGSAPDVAATVPPPPLPFVPGSWTIAVLPDTQNYTLASPSYAHIFEAQTDWIVQNKETRNIIFVLHLGDIVNNNVTNQWEVAQRAMTILDGEVPYAFVPGNHDYGSNGSSNNRQTLLNDYFPIANYTGWPTFGGAMEPGKMDNTYHLFQAGGKNWLVLALEWGPRNQAIAWANNIVTQYPNHKVILITHAYTYFDDTRYDWKTKGASQSWNPYAYGTAQDPDGTNDGEDLWQKLARKHRGFVFIMNGHVLNDGLGRLSSWGDHTNIVHQLLVNYQMRSLGGEGYLRLLEFLPDGKTVQVKAYSPYLDRYFTDSQNQFVLDLDPPPPISPPPAVVLFEDDFNRGIPGWTAVQQPAAYFDGPMRWQYDIVSGVFVEQSNIYTDSAASSPSATAVMLINDAVAPAAFTYQARLTAGDDDGFGLIFGYQNETNFYRVTFTRQNRTATPGFPGSGWRVDRKVNNSPVVLFAAPAGSFTNTANRPFDVTITVTAANLFSLTVVDNPGGTSTTYPLVQNQLLLGSAAGQVGLISWGMSGGNPLGFRINNLTLSPTPLAGNPNDLAHWTPVVPRNSRGSSTLTGGNGGKALWSLALGASGPLGRLYENSDSFASATNVSGNWNTDFIAPSLVTGDLNWSNYVVTARIIPADDDGHGILLRYLNETNFYRVALAQAAANPTGRPPAGLSVQKVVNGVWSEAYREATIKYDPTPNAPYDLIAAMKGDRLSIRVIPNPDGISQPLYYGPFDITGARVEKGKIGLFSWGMSRTEFDFVRVEGIVPLQITRVRVSGNMVALDIANHTGIPYLIEFSTDLTPGSWTTVATGQIEPQWNGPLPVGASQAFYRLREGP